MRKAPPSIMKDHIILKRTYKVSERLTNAKQVEWEDIIKLTEDLKKKIK